MRRALLIVTLLAPALAWAQTSGGILLVNHRTFPNYVNAAECAGLATIDVRWNASGTAFPPGGVYTLYASNQQITTTGTCPTASNTTTGLIVLPVATVTTAAGLVADAIVSGSQLITGSAGNIASCDSAADQTIYLCVQGTVGGVSFGFATGSVIVSTTKPPAPVITGAGPGNGALNVSWDAGSATTSAPANTQEYSFEATPVGSVGTVQDSGRVSSSPHRFGGLQNGVVYSVRAFAYSIADNPSDPSDAVTGMPEAVLDFWNAYQGDGGRESGGCASGVAGPVGLGILLATLALVRRRK